MADKELSSSHQNGRIAGVVPKSSPTPHQNCGMDAELGRHSPRDTSPLPKAHTAPSSRTSVSTSPLRTLGGLVTPVLGSGPECSSSSTRPQSQSLGSALSSSTRTIANRSRRRSSQQEESEALLDLILESQSQRLDDQRASINLLPDPGSAALCGACSPDQPHLPVLDFYYMLIHYQSDRMEDQRCPLPDLDDVIGSVPEGQEDFFSLIQRVQSRRMDEQRASLLMTHNKDDDDDADSNGSYPHRRHHF
ncbi:G-protein-signaling modulator 1-like [Seriola lalandi dorsalis]|uniref:G-protein-signaling modulator 1-like n=1 Tax=Seriola lalandi dorsalis TaxID=1841481 RepID=UPI000C6F975D|nr:G-protein-signaling modulator 1-like [Seriola lalandi dorsalis]XP_056231268.1 G-protein-signaling modulator 1 [Seriola aureovittata]